MAASRSGTVRKVVRRHATIQQSAAIQPIYDRDWMWAMGECSFNTLKEGKKMSATTLTRLVDQDAPLVLPYRPLGLATSFLANEHVYPGAVGITLGGFGLFLLFAVIRALGIKCFGPMITRGAKLAGNSTATRRSAVSCDS
jgi:hypothetical protein